MDSIYLGKELDLIGQVWTRLDLNLTCLDLDVFFKLNLTLTFLDLDWNKTGTKLEFRPTTSP